MAALVLVIVAGSLGYVLLGFGVLDAIYQTVTTVTTVGFREVQPINTPTRQIFTIVLVLLGVGTAFYTFGVSLEALVEGHLRTYLRERRMQREISALRDHVIVCGWGRVGRACGEYAARSGAEVVVIDRNPIRVEDLGFRTLLGDVTDDAVLEAAGIGRARALVAALETDADNVYVTLSGRALRPDLVIIARARTESSEPKLRRAGADHVVNPQRLGGDRMAAFAVQPHVMDFLDVVMHDGSLEMRIEEAVVAEGTTLDGRQLDRSELNRATGALVVALREPGGTFVTNPPSDTVLSPGHVLIVLGSTDELAALQRIAGAPG